MKSSEIAKGQVLTVLQWHPVNGKPHNYSCLGWALKVLAVQLPFIRVEFMQGVLDDPFPIDTRQCDLMELNPDFYIDEGTTHGD